MIRNRNYHNLFMDYSSYTKSGEHPSDIDMFYITEDDTLILGEIKNESYDRNYWKKQKKILQRVVDNYNKKAMYFFITHNKYVQNGDTEVDVPNCYIKEYYYKGKWRKPKKQIKVKDIIKKYINKENKMEVISNKDEMIFRKDFDDKTLYSISLTRKDANGGYIHGYIQVNFKDKTNIPNKSKIRINHGWLSFYLKEGKTIPTIWIDDYNLVGEPKPKEENPFEQFGNSIKTEVDEQIEIKPEDLPF